MKVISMEDASAIGPILHCFQQVAIPHWNGLRNLLRRELQLLIIHRRGEWMKQETGSARNQR